MEGTRGVGNRAWNEADYRGRQTGNTESCLTGLQTENVGTAARNGRQNWSSMWNRAGRNRQVNNQRAFSQDRAHLQDKLIGLHLVAVPSDALDRQGVSRSEWTGIRRRFARELNSEEDEMPMRLRRNFWRTGARDWCSASRTVVGVTLVATGMAMRDADAATHHCHPSGRDEMNYKSVLIAKCDHNVDPNLSLPLSQEPADTSFHSKRLNPRVVAAT